MNKSGIWWYGTTQYGGTEDNTVGFYLQGSRLGIDYVCIDGLSGGGCDKLE